MFGKSRKQAWARADELLALVKLNDPATLKRRVGQYSGGMRRRLDLALALVHEPRILFLDEPTTGLDPASRRDIWAEVRRLNQQLGMTIFLTTQYLEEADELADRISILNQGTIVAEGAPYELKQQMGSESIKITFRSGEAAQQASVLLADMSATPPQLEGSVLRLYMNNTAAAIVTVADRLHINGLETTLLTLTQPTLDDVFLEVTGQRLSAEQDQPSFELHEPSIA
jgi:ABC-2 type transport system ATP-binding protein